MYENPTGVPRVGGVEQGWILHNWWPYKRQKISLQKRVERPQRQFFYDRKSTKWQRQTFRGHWMTTGSSPTWGPWKAPIALKLSKILRIKKHLVRGDILAELGVQIVCYNTFHIANHFPDILQLHKETVHWRYGKIRQQNYFSPEIKPLHCFFFCRDMFKTTFEGQFVSWAS